MKLLINIDDIAEYIYFILKNVDIQWKYIPLRYNPFKNYLHFENNFMDIIFSIITLQIFPNNLFSSSSVIFLFV